MIRQLLLLTLVFSTLPVKAFDTFGYPDYAGNISSLMNEGSSALSTKTIAPSRFEPGQGPGKVVGNVNIFTGQPAYSIPLGALNARGAVSYPIVLNYGGPVRPIFESDNERAPAGWVGLGFSLTTPFVATNHKGTYNSADDVIFCNLGPFGGGQIIQNPTTKKFFLASNPYIQITALLGSGEFAGQFVRWTFQMPDGTKLVFGETANAQRHVFYNGTLIKASPFPNVASKKFIYRWDISHIADFNGANKILFDHAQYLENAGQGRSYVREGYVKNIKWLGPGNTEVERYEFVTQERPIGEYQPYRTGEAKDDQKLFETRYLHEIKCYREGNHTHSYSFTFDRARVADLQQVKGKALLTEIQLYYNSTSGNLVKDNGWKFSYEGLSNFFLLKSVTTPDLRTDSFSYKSMDFAATDGDQDWSASRMRRSDHKTAVPLPANKTNTAKWKGEAKCDERFCYLIMKDGDGVEPDELSRTQKMYVEIRPNMGNYFDSTSSTAVKRFENGTTSTPIEDLDVIPGGDFFLVVDYKYGSIDFWEWNGVEMVQKYPFANDPRYATGNFRHRIRIHSAGNYFLIHKTALRSSGSITTPAEIIPVLRQSNGVWTSLNKNSSLCELENKSIAVGDAIRSSTGNCLEFDTDDLIVSASQTFFTLVHKPKDVILFYALKSDGDGFSNLTNTLPVVTGAAQKSGYPMNWEEHIEGVALGRDYLVLSTSNSARTLHSVHPLFFNGDRVMALPGRKGHNSGPFIVHTSGDYFLAHDKERLFAHWQRKINSTGTLVFEQTTPQIDMLRPESPWLAEVQVRTHPSGFVIEYYAHRDSIGTRPLEIWSGTNYAVNVFKRNWGSLGYANVTSQFLYEGKNVFNVNFSSSDNSITALAGADAGGGTCGAKETCNIKHVVIRYRPDHPTVFTNLNADLNVYALPYDNVVKRTHDFSSGAGRLVMRPYLDWSRKVVEYNLFQWTGQSLGTPTGPGVVDQFSTNAGLDNNQRNVITYSFNYTKSPVWRREFNSNLQVPQFEACEVAQTNSDNTSRGFNRFLFHLDTKQSPMYGKKALLNGHEKYHVSIGTGADTSMRVDIVSEPVTNSAWPASLYTMRLYKSTSKEVADNKSYRITTTSYHRYNENNGAPHFVVSALGNRFLASNLGFGAHQVSQTLFNGQHLPSQSIAFGTFTYPDTASLKTISTTSPLSTQTTYAALSPIASSKTTWNSNYLQQKSEVWRDVDEALTTTQMGTGMVPKFDITQGWIPAGEITQRNAYNQTLETKTPRTTAVGDDAYASFFYEGRASQPVAMVANARLDNCAVLLAENGNAGLSGLDYPAKWERPPTVTFEHGRSRTGRYSLKVVDSYGPTLNRHLKDVTRYKFGYQMSAWVFAPTGTTPLMAVERRNSAGTHVNSFLGSPVDGYIIHNRWQRGR